MLRSCLRKHVTLKTAGLPLSSVPLRSCAVIENTGVTTAGTVTVKLNTAPPPTDTRPMALVTALADTPKSELKASVGQTSSFTATLHVITSEISIKVGSLKLPAQLRLEAAVGTP